VVRTLPFVLDQGLRGHHHLFDGALLRDVLGRVPLDGDLEAWVEPRVALAATELLDALETDEDLEVQRERIARAPRRVQEVLVHLYFRFLYRYLEGRSPVLH
jgi:hypothetical protein